MTAKNQMLSLGTEDWVVDILTAGAAGTLVVFLLRKFLYSVILESLAERFDKAAEADSKDKVRTFLPFFLTS